MLRPCPSCGTHLRPGDACPACGARRRGGTSAAAVILALGLSGCPFDDKDTGDDPPDWTETAEDTETRTDTGDLAMYGVAYVDEDGDGYHSYEDCNDKDPAVHPGAKETPGDGIDSNCNGEDNK